MLPDMSVSVGTIIYIPVYNVTTVSFDVNKASYSAWYILDDEENILESNTGRNTNTISCNLNVENFEYIQFKNNSNGSGSSGCSIKNFKAH